MMETDDEVRTWEKRLVAGLAAALVAAFTVWAGVVWNGTSELVGELRAVRAEMAQDRLDNAEYRTLMERRVTILEQRQSMVIDALRNRDEHPALL